MIDLLEAAIGLQRFCDRHGWRSCVIGGIAVQRRGEPRVTRDVDLTILAGFGGEGEIIDELLAECIAQSRSFAADEEGVGIDASLGALPFEEIVVARATIKSWRTQECVRHVRCVMI